MRRWDGDWTDLKCSGDGPGHGDVPGHVVTSLRIRIFPIVIKYVSDI